MNPALEPPRNRLVLFVTNSLALSSRNWANSSNLDHGPPGGNEAWRGLTGERGKAVSCPARVLMRPWRQPKGVGNAYARIDSEPARFQAIHSEMFQSRGRGSPDARSVGGENAFVAGAEKEMVGGRPGGFASQMRTRSPQGEQAAVVFHDPDVPHMEGKRIGRIDGKRSGLPRFRGVVEKIQNLFAYQRRRAGQKRHRGPQKAAP